MVLRIQLVRDNFLIIIFLNGELNKQSLLVQIYLKTNRIIKTGKIQLENDTTLLFKMPGNVQSNSIPANKIKFVKLKVGNNSVQIKTSSIHHLVKKFARSIFKSYNINEKDGYLIYEQFRNWLTSNKSLYDDYYNGFHSEIWQI